MTASALDFSSRRVLVTGGTRGIGAAVVELFSAAGAEVLATGTDAVRVAEFNRAAEAQALNVHYVAVDFSDASELSTFCEELTTIGPFDACVNNAGTNRILPLEEVSADDFQWLTTINLGAPLQIARAVAGGMKRAHYGRIVNVASIWSVVTRPQRSLYTAAKSGLVGLTRALAVELAPDGILVNAVSPGFTLTDLTRSSLTVKEIGDLEEKIPCGRMAEPLEIARMVLFLSSELNSYTTGQNLVVDGGFVSI